MSTMFSTFVPQSTEDDARVQHLMHRVAAMCKARGVSIKNCYTDLDRAPTANPSRQNAYRCGKVTRSQFVRNFPFKKEIDEAEVELLVERYTTPSGDVHFMAMHNDVSEVLPDPAQPFPTSPLYLRPDNTQWSHQLTKAVTRMQSKVVERRVRLREFFSDFDALRKGLCAAGQLKTALTIASFDKYLSKGDFEELLNTYSLEDGQFNYDQMCKDVDQAFAVTGLEKMPLHRSEMPDAETTSP